MSVDILHPVTKCIKALDSGVMPVAARIQNYCRMFHQSSKTVQVLAQDFCFLWRRTHYSKKHTACFCERFFFLSWHLWKMPTMGHWPAGDSPAPMLTQKVILVGGQRVQLPELRAWASHSAGRRHSPASCSGLGGQLCQCHQLCLCRQLWPYRQLCLCSRATRGWNHNSFPLLASWAACPWDTGMRALFNSKFYGVPFNPL